MTTGCTNSVGDRIGWQARADCNIMITRQDFVAADAVTCRHGWTGTQGIQVSVPGGPHRVIADVRRVDDYWAVRIVARAADGSGSSSNEVPFRVIRQATRYLVCGYAGG